ncbi:unnamed protein product, partial [Brenthis ino]
MADKTIIAGNIVTLLQEGCTQCYVSERFGVSRSTVQRTWTRFQETDSLKKRPGSERKRCTEPRDDRYIIPTAEGTQPPGTSEDVPASPSIASPLPHSSAPYPDIISPEPPMDVEWLE